MSSISWLHHVSLQLQNLKTFNISRIFYLNWKNSNIFLLNKLWVIGFLNKETNIFISSLSRSSKCCSHMRSCMSFMSVVKVWVLVISALYTHSKNATIKENEWVYKTWSFSLSLKFSFSDLFWYLMHTFFPFLRITLLLLFVTNFQNTI